jgi:hypothetical protein
MWPSLTELSTALSVILGWYGSRNEVCANGYT